MIGPSRALRLVLAGMRPTPPIRVPVSEAGGRVTTRIIRAPFDLPRFASSSKDGYALPSAATRGATRGKPARLRIGRRAILAGSPPGSAVRGNAALRIMTGAPLPGGVDAVLPREEGRAAGGWLFVSRPVPPGQHVRPAAQDCHRGDPIVPKGRRLQPGTIALLSILGVRQVHVRRPPRVAIVVTGNEVRPLAARSLPRYAVRDAHAAFLTAALREFDLRPSHVAYVRDSAVELRKALRAATARADLVVVTGGVAVGDRDLVRGALSSIGARTVFWRVAQKPGKPLYFGTRRGVPVFGLPGNPASVVVCYCEYVRPAIRKMLGERKVAPEEWQARLASPVPRDESRVGFLRGRLARRGREWRVSADRRQSSNLLGPFLESNSLIIVPPGRGSPLRPGSRVCVHPLPWSRE